MPSGPRPDPPTRFCKLVYHGSYGSTTWNNVMWLYLTGSGEITVPNLNDLAAACSGAYIDNFGPYLSSALSLDDTQVVLYAGGGDVFEGHAVSGGSGSATGGDLPANVAMCITWQIAPHYRGGHPRTYLAGMVDGHQLDATTWQGASVSALSSAAAAFHTDLEAISGVGSGITDVEHGVASFVRDGAWRTPPVFYRIVTGFVDTRIDTQRRRLGPDR